MSAMPWAGKSSPRPRGALEPQALLRDAPTGAPAQRASGPHGADRASAAAAARSSSSPTTSRSSRAATSPSARQRPQRRQRSGSWGQAWQTRPPPASRRSERVGGPHRAHGSASRRRRWQRRQTLPPSTTHSSSRGSSQSSVRDVPVLPERLVELADAADVAVFCELSTALHVRPPELVRVLVWLARPESPQGAPVEDGVGGVTTYVQPRRRHGPLDALQRTQQIDPEPFVRA
jgi:hypothetical protein